MRDKVTGGWRAVFLVCRKCSKRQGGGFGPSGRTSLAKLLRRLLPEGKARQASFGVVETKCLGICPKHAVVCIDARLPAEWQLVQPGSSTTEIVRRLNLHELLEQAEPQP